MDDDTEYARVAECLQRLNLTHSPAAWHGLLCGALCVDDAGNVDVTHLATGDTPAAEDAAALDGLMAWCGRSQAALNDAQGVFAPLLPTDESALGSRARALAEWCEGFVFSLGGRRRFDIDSCSADVREIVRDFTELTRAALGEADDPEEEETAYAELVEYVRVGAQLVFVELRRPPAGVPGRDARTLH